MQDSDEQRHVEGLRIARIKQYAYLAALQSPEVRALVTALEALVSCQWVSGTASPAVDRAINALAPWKEAQ